MRTCIAYVPARGGSKRVPGKNIKKLGGTPVLVHVIRTLKQLRFLKAVCVSTEDPGIASVAERAGASVLRLRRADLADDHADFKALLREDLPRYLDHFDIPASRADVLFTLATAALVPPAFYARAHEVFVKEQAAILVPTRAYLHSPFRALVESCSGWRPLFPEKLLERSQDLPAAVSDTGLFYWLDFARMVNQPAHWFAVKKGLVCLPTDPSFTVDVDTPADWTELEKKYRARRSGRT